LDEDLGRIVSAVRMERRIFENLRKVMIYIAAMHVPIAGLALLPIAFGLPPVLLPVHIALTEMIIDPACSVVFEQTPEEPDIMHRGPRRASLPIIGRAQLLLALVQGLSLLAGTLGIYWLALTEALPTDEARALTFIALTAGNLALVRLNATRGGAFKDLFRRGHGAFWILASAATAAMVLALVVPALRDLLRFDTPPFALIAVAIAAGVGTVAWLDALKCTKLMKQALAG
jgi:Ca2+-transporting ATPase